MQQNRINLEENMTHFVERLPKMNNEAKEIGIQIAVPIIVATVTRGGVFTMTAANA
jgi:hypothetical protein